MHSCSFTHSFRSGTPSCTLTPLCIKVEGSRTVVYFLLASFHAICSLKQVGRDEQALLGPCSWKRLLHRQLIQEVWSLLFSSPSSLHGQPQPILQEVFPSKSDITDIFMINHLNTEPKTHLYMFPLKLFSKKNMKRETLLCLIRV